ncbi:hypothetical protein U9M48_021024 [Paspalum notatum var. saurae]|uniref:Uncharacterized protein n=1 Tax=Paspalum notatum var. saurae TaxID=547442 RepID=A0AAQ3WTE5_PASNO
MEPLASAVVPPRRLGGQQTQAGIGGWARRLAPLLLVLAVTGSFVAAAYSARRSTRDLVFVLVAYYLLALLACCVAKLEQLRRRDGDGDGETERRRVRFAVWAVSVALVNTFAPRVADEMPGLALKLVVWGLSVSVLALGFYLIFCSKDAERCNAEHGLGHDGVGRRQEQAPYELSLEGPGTV